jgi:hypothetical protein
MSGSATLERPETLTVEDDSVKRRQILEGGARFSLLRALMPPG